MKNIVILGHSIASWSGYDIYGQKSFIDLLVEQLNYNLLAIGVREGSEERILQTLKKQKDLDIAIIFHSRAKHLYLPGCDRDVVINKIDKSKCDYLIKISNPIREKFKDSNTLHRFINEYNQYLNDPSVQNDRFIGALLQIDQFCFHKGIKCIHIPLTDNIPSWFNFASGNCKPHIQEIANTHLEKGYPNGLSQQGQNVLAELLIAELSIL